MTVTSTIGTGGRNYSTLSAWAASIPATLADAYVGQCYNDSEFASSSQLLSLSGHTTSATHTITLTTAPGQSFADNANAQTNALHYNQANGVGINFSGAYAAAISVGDGYVTVSKLQLKATAALGGALETTSNGTNFTIDGCLLEGAGTNSNRLPLNLAGSSGTVRNCLIVGRASSMPALISGIAPNTIANCTLVVPSDLTAASVAINSAYSTLTVKNCAIFHVTALKSGSSTFAWTSCATDVASPPSGVTTVTYGNQFQNTTNAGGDWRLKSGADCIDAGTTDTSDIPAAIDIVGTSRPQGSAWDIGCWEYKSAATLLALAARGGAMAVARAAGTFGAAIAARAAAQGRARPGAGYTGALSARGAAATAARPAISAAAALPARAGAMAKAAPGAGFVAILSSRSAGTSRAVAGGSATTALFARAGAAGRAFATLGSGAVLALVARAFGIGAGSGAVQAAAPLLGRGQARGRGRAAVAAPAALAACGTAGTAAAATLSAGVRLAVATRAFAVGFARAVLALVTPTAVVNPELEIVAAQPPGKTIAGQKNVLTLTAVGSGTSLTATNKGPQQG
jgi:hypothetical protein